MTEILLGFETAFTATNLLYCLIGVTLGTVIGMLPGLGSASGVGLLLPLTFGLEPVTAIIMLAGIYYGAQYGGTISSVLIGAPGEAATAVTVLEGHQMARRGRAGQALAIAAIASFVAGVLSLVVVMFVSPLLANVALQFGPPEMVAVILLALVATVGFTAGGRTKGLLCLGLGLVVATVGIDPVLGTERFTFGRIELLGGLGFIEVVIGVFAIAEILRNVSARHSPQVARPSWGEMMLSKNDLKVSTAPIVRGSGIGTVMGVVPGAGSTLASFASYGVERTVAKGKGFGKGAIQGVAGPEAANNAGANGSFIPTLSLGIPGSATTAVLLGALTLHGIQPGPLLIEQQPVLVWGVLASFLIGNAILLILNLPLAPLFASVLTVPYKRLYPVILAVCIIGAYAVENSMTGVWVAVAFGIVGYFLQKYDYPLLPLILGLILGPMLEQGLAQSVQMGGGSYAIFADRPLALVFLALTALALVLPPVVRGIRSRRTRSADKLVSR
ncbi:tripartite tricarboxylate transporter permease [Georgenia sp. Z1491]|uniref:tripartite tricarboxylate transporter permease n=1 Tax=Georgenia sp. Z1491 TaxID=3416707 RepID=UPI003CEE4957